MRTARQIPWFLIASILISLSALALANFIAPPLKEPGSYLALALVILIPGYLAVLIMFPAGGDLDLGRRLLLSLGASLLLAGLISLILYLTPRGLKPASFATILSLLTLLLAAISYLRWSALPYNRRFIIGANRGYRTRRPASRLSRSFISRQNPLLIAALAAILILAGLSLAFYYYNPDMDFISSPEGYTVLEVTWPESEVADISEPQYTALTAGRDLEARARIINHEGSALNYSLRLVFHNSTIFVKGLSLADDETWDSMLGFMLSGQPGRQSLELLLFKEGDSTPYKSDHLLLDLLEEEPMYPDKSLNSSIESNNISTGTPVSFEETTKVTVLSVSSGSGSQVSGSTAAKSIPGKSQSQSISKKSRMEREKMAKETAEDTRKEKAIEAATEREMESDEEISKNTSSAEAALQASEINTKTNAPKEISSKINAQLAANASSEEKPSIEETQSSPSSSSFGRPASYQSSTAGPKDVIPNQPPVLQNLLPDRPSPLTRGTAIFWRAEATDPDGDTILYRFLLNGEEKRKWSKSSSWSWATQYLPAGDYTITVQVIDGLHSPSSSFDSSLDATMTVSEQNQLPFLKELEASPESPSPQGLQITWIATAIDPDGDNLYYRFLLDGQEVSSWSLSDSWIWNSSGMEPGEHTITVQTKDGFHAKQDSFDEEMNRPYTLTESKKSSSIDSSVASGASPIASINQIPVLLELEPDAISPLKTGAIINWTAKAADPDGDELSYKFLLDGQDVAGWSSSAFWSWNTSSAIPGEHKITVLTRDGAHASREFSDSSLDATLYLDATLSQESKNLPPVLLSLKPDLPSPQVKGSAILWRAEAIDPDNDPILYKFQVGGKDMGRWSESSSWNWSTGGLAAGDYKIAVMARDGCHSSEYSFDSSLMESFSLNTAIDQQIDQLMSQRGFGASADSSYCSSAIRVDVLDKI